MAKRKAKKSDKKFVEKKPAKKVSKPKKRKVVKTNKSSLAIAIVALILNVAIVPGLGSLIGRRIKAGIWQLVLVLLGIPLSIFIIGIPMVIAGYIWGIVTGVRLIQEAQ